jgi:hypothetical protein
MKVAKVKRGPDGKLTELAAAEMIIAMFRMRKARKAAEKRK